MSPELNHGGKLPTLLVSLANRRGFRLTDHKHAESMGVTSTPSKPIRALSGLSARYTQDVVRGWHGAGNPQCSIPIHRGKPQKRRLAWRKTQKCSSWGAS